MFRKTTSNELKRFLKSLFPDVVFRAKRGRGTARNTIDVDFWACNTMQANHEIAKKIHRWLEPFQAENKEQIILLHGHKKINSTCPKAPRSED